MPKLPFMKFFVNDWVSDYELAKCSLETRGFWFELLCAMHNLDRSGVVTGTTEEISRICRCQAVDVGRCADELRTKKVGDVSERNGVYTFINRRMRREFTESENAKKRQIKFKGKEKTENKRKINGIDIDNRDREKENNIIKEKNLISIAEQIRKHHPRPSKPIYTDQLIMELLISHGENAESFAQRLSEKTQKYAAAVSQWPVGERKFIAGSFEWFKGGCYDEPEENWIRKEGANNGEFKSVGF